ncbi:hypothetical protein [Saccharopolyspora rosea]|uniref:DUF4386 family protein n=1 Tax=Saccharopolyspora rosea TaxID=524884 RepID=A0ABW3FVQ5_9PSEU|nr:hypothetical protein [Saccharopolyspora rosea]
MAEKHEMRWGGLAGIGSLVLVLIAGILLRGAPRIADSADTISAFLVSWRTTVMAAVLLYLAAAALFVWFGSTMATAFRLAMPNSDGPAVVLAGFVLTGTIAFLGTAALGGMAYALTNHPVLLGLAAAPYTALGIVATLTGMAVALPLAACAACIARTDVFPQWTAWFSGVVAVIAVLGAITVVLGGALATGGAVAGYVPSVLTGLWMLTMSVFLVREHLPMVTTGRERAPGPA